LPDKREMKVLGVKKWHFAPPFQTKIFLKKKPDFFDFFRFGWPDICINGM
jgi:hypothetical protein